MSTQVAPSYTSSPPPAPAVPQDNRADWESVSQNHFTSIQNLYFDTDLVWRMQLMIIKGYDSCCLCREFSTLSSH